MGAIGSLEDSLKELSTSKTNKIVFPLFPYICHHYIVLDMDTTFLGPQNIESRQIFYQRLRLVPQTQRF